MRIESPSRRRGVRIGLTPLIDVVFLLLVFFIMGGRFEEEARIRLAASSAAGAAGASPPLALLAIDGATVWRLAGRAASPDAILPELVEAIRLQPDLQVVIVPGAGLDTQTLVVAIDRLREAGFDRLGYLAD